jgi:hypothetical protein
MLTAAAERAVDGKDPTEAEVERLYRMFRDSTTRRARRRSRGLAPSVGVRTSEQNSRSCIAQPGNFEASCEDSPSRAELAEERAQWILTRCGEEFAKSLVAMRDVGGLDDAMRVLKQKLVAIKQKREPAGR